MPKPKSALPSAEYLRECFHYDPETGILTWKHRPRTHFSSDRDWQWWNKRWAEQIAGSITAFGYRTIRINSIDYFSSRLIWKIVTGEEPIDTVDHINLSRDDNRWINLRLATVHEQNRNRRSRLRGVSPRGKRWGAGIKVDGIYQWLGTFDTREEATTAYEATAHKLFGEFYHSGTEE